jgi:hypothetical protein
MSGYHLVKNFVQKQEVSELVLITDKTKEPKQLDFDNSHKVNVKDCWSLIVIELLSIIKTVLRKADAVLFNLQF